MLEQVQQGALLQVDHITLRELDVPCCKQAFEWLPVGAVIEDRILCLHGGAPNLLSNDIFLNFDLSLSFVIPLGMKVLEAQ